ncbi:hypothetical protein GCM10018966_054620 [Streptomyces yanii]
MTQIPPVSHIADVPKPETTTAVRYSPALRSRSTFPAAAPVIAPPYLVDLQFRQELMLATKDGPGHRADALHRGRRKFFRQKR